MLSHHKYPASLAAVSLLILGGGMALKPARPAAEPALSPTETARLERFAQRKALQDMSAYFTGVADEAAASVVRLPGAASTGIVWNVRGTVVAPAGGGALAELRVATHQPGSRVSGRPVSLSDPQAYPPGSWVVLVTRRRDGQRQFAPGVYSGVSQGACGDFAYREIQTTVPLSPAMLGGGIFDMDGGLLGVALGCGEHVTAIAGGDVARALTRASAPERRLLERAGLRAAPLDEAERAYFGAEEGLLVSEVVRGSVADGAGLLPGDILTAVDGQPVRSAADLAPLENTAAGELTVLRARRTRQLKWGAAPAPAGILVATAEPGYVVETLTPESPAARAGIRAGDHLLRVNGRAPASRPGLLRLLAVGKPSYVVLQRGPREMGVLLVP